MAERYKKFTKAKVIRDEGYSYPMYREDYLIDDFVEELHSKYFQNWRRMPKRGKAAVLGIDLQNYFLCSDEDAYLPSAPRLVEKLQRFYKFVKISGAPIILTRHCHRDNILARWWGNVMDCTSNSTKIYHKLQDFADYTIQKDTYDAFYNTSLENTLRENRIDTLIITGVMTHLCCETTAREAFVRGFNVIFPIDGTLTQNAELHEGTIRALSHGFAAVPTLKEVEAWLKMR